MLTLTQSASVRGSSGDPLPEVWKGLADKGTKFLRGQLVLIAAGPGSGKSALALSYALKSGVSALYFSADSDAFIQLSRSLSILGGLTMEESGMLALSGDVSKIADIVGESPVRFSYHPTPTLEHINRQVRAYEELYGDYPELIIVDNAMDVEIGDADEDQSRGLDALMAWLHDMARTTEACVIVLHHVTGPYNDAAGPIPLSGVKGQIGRVPELILTIHRGSDTYAGTTSIKVSTVKNRGAKADPSGQTYANLEFDGDHMDIKDVVPTQYDNPFDST